jgi:hypothetical protein
MIQDLAAANWVSMLSSLAVLPPGMEEKRVAEHVRLGGFAFAKTLLRGMVGRGIERDRLHAVLEVCRRELSDTEWLALGAEVELLDGR